MFAERAPRATAARHVAAYLLLFAGLIGLGWLVVQTPQPVPLPVDLGSPGDEQLISDFWLPERTDIRTFRWTSDDSGIDRHVLARLAHRARRTAAALCRLADR